MENITDEHVCSVLPLMRVSSLAAQQLQAASFLMHSFSSRCERGNFFGAQMNLLALHISITFPLGLPRGGGGHWNVSGMFSTGRACVQDLFWKYAFAFRLSDHDSTRNIIPTP